MDNLLQEIWKRVPGTNGFYSVSDQGNVRSNDRVIVDVNGKVLKLKGKLLKMFYDEYVYVDLGKGNKHLVHRLVASAYVPNPFNKPCVNHKFGNKHDNRASVLEWVTYSENERHSYDVLGKKANTSHLGLKGIECKHSKPIAMLDGEDFSIQCAAPTLRAMSRAFNLDTLALRDVCNGKREHHKTMLVMKGKKERYLNKSQGILKLFVSDIFITKKQFRNIAQRKQIMEEWARAFQFFNTMTPIYIQVGHYDTGYEAPAKEAEPVLPATLKIKKRVYKNTVEKKLNFIRPKAEYSNKSFHNPTDTMLV